MRRLRGLIVVLWRAGLRIHEALALAEADLDARRGLAAGAARQGRPAPRGRHGRLGVGAAEPWLQARVALSGDNAEIIDTVHARRAPIVPVDSSLAL